MPSAPRSRRSPTAPPSRSRPRPARRRSSRYSRAMSGTDHLFPDATPLPGAAVPPPPPALAETAPSGPVAPPPVARRRRGLGAAAFVLGLLAILGDLIGVTIALFTLLGA